MSRERATPHHQHSGSWHGELKQDAFAPAPSGSRHTPIAWLKYHPAERRARRAAAQDAQTQQLAGSRFAPRPTQVLVFFDFLFLAAANGVMVLGIHNRLDVLSLTEALVATVSATGITMMFLYAMGCFRRDAIVSKPNAISRLPIVIGLSAVTLFLVLHFGLPFIFAKARVYLSISRCLTISFVSAGASLAALVICRYMFFAMMHRHWFVRRIMVIGHGERTSHLTALMMREPHRSHVQLVIFDETVLAKGGSGEGKSLETLATELAVDEIVIAVDNPRALPFENLLACKVRGVPITNYDTYMERETGRVDLRFVDPSYLVYSSGFQMRVMDRIAKRTTDIVLSLVLLAVSLPIFAAAALAVWIEDRGAIFYKQERVTQGDRVFWLYKLRTMRPDAEKDGARWAAKVDARVTKVGKFLRRTRIDEIPQLINILKGDMSLVGPRPERPVLIDQISKDVRMFALRHGVKTGLTGWAQINYPYGASVEDAAHKLEYDIYYMKNYSWFRDISIILQTIRIVILQEGAR